MSTINGTTRDYNKLSDAIDTRQNYRTNGSLSGEYVAETRDSVAHYVIRSYDEVIGFMTYHDKWASIITRKFSVTTSRHTSVAFTALKSNAKHIHKCDPSSRLSANGEEY